MLVSINITIGLLAAFVSVNFRAKHNLKLWFCCFHLMLHFKYILYSYCYCQGRNIYVKINALTISSNAFAKNNLKLFLFDVVFPS